MPLSSENKRLTEDQSKKQHIAKFCNNQHFILFVINGLTYKVNNHDQLCLPFVTELVSTDLVETKFHFNKIVFIKSIVFKKLDNTTKSTFI